MDCTEESHCWINTPVSSPFETSRPRAPSLGCSHLFAKDSEPNTHRVKNPLYCFTSDLIEALNQASNKLPYYTPESSIHSCEIARNVHRRKKRDWNLMEGDTTQERLSPISALCHQLKSKRTFTEESVNSIKRTKPGEDELESNTYLEFDEDNYNEELVVELFYKYHRLCPDVDSLPIHLQDLNYISGSGLSSLMNDFGWPNTPVPGITAFFYLISTELLFAISLSEFCSAFKLLRTSTIGEAKNRSYYYHREFLKDRNEHIQYACHAFRFFNGVNQKAAPLQIVLKLLFLLMGSSSYFTAYFAQYLTVSEIRYLNFDQWRNFIPFSCEIYSDCSNYRESDAWPTIYDGFVSWFQGLSKMKSSNDHFGPSKRFMDMDAVLQMRSPHLVTR